VGSVIDGVDIVQDFAHARYVVENADIIEAM
jgi:hypothetical protein